MQPAPHLFTTAKAEATRLLRKLGIEGIPVDPFDLAQRLDIELKALPMKAGGASGMLLRAGEQFGICYPTHVASEGFVRFSVAHEIGHYWLPGHADAVLHGGIHRSHAGCQSTDKYEREADDFAAALLMPAAPFRAAMGKAGEGLGAIEALAATCRTSLEATAIRFVELSDDPVAVICSKGAHVEYAKMSYRLRDFPKIEWIRKGARLPLDTATAAFNADPKRVESGARDKDGSSLQDWLEAPYQQEIVEEVVGLGKYGKTLTVLTGMEAPEWLDEEEDTEWEPRFR